MSSRALGVQFEAVHHSHLGISVTAKAGDRVVGELHTFGRREYDAEEGRFRAPGEVGWVQVEPSHQRQGIGTALWERAHAYAAQNKLAPPRHSPTRTPEGDAWVQKVGGTVPKRKKAV